MPADRKEKNLISIDSWVRFILTEAYALLLLAFAGGCVGAAFGMALCRHKTRHARFVILVPLSLLLWAAAIAVLLLHLNHIF